MSSQDQPMRPPWRVWPPAADDAPIPLHDSATNRQAELDAARRWPPHTLMQRAGVAVAALARALAPHARRIDILAGPGNNGGDGFEAALHLRRAGVELQVLTLGDAGRLPPDAAASLQRALAAGVPVSPWREDSTLPGGPRDLVIDALLGRGLSRPAEGRLAQAIAATHGQRAPVLAVDLPSGLPADSGALAPGAPCVRAAATLALLGVAPGLFTADGRDHAGQVWCDDLGAPPPPSQAAAWLERGSAAHQGARAHRQHKGSFGDVHVVAGAPGMAGAARLAARAALRAGAGRVYLRPLASTGDGDADAGLDPTLPELMFGPPVGSTPLGTGATVVAGCGGGLPVARVLPDLIEQASRLVLDADALNALATDASLQQALTQRAARGLATVLTPHPLEAARLLGHGSAGAVQSDRLTAATTLAERWGAVVVLKGSGTVIAAPDGARWINASGNAALAVPGSGDVLAGWLAGLWSAAASGSGQDRCAGETALALATARCAVWRHGHLAAQLSPKAQALSARTLADAIAPPGRT